MILSTGVLESSILRSNNEIKLEKKKKIEERNGIILLHGSLT